MGPSHTFFADMVTELGLAAEMKSGAEYTLLAPFNAVFTGESCTRHYCYIMNHQHHHYHHHHHPTTITTTTTIITTSTTITTTTIII